MALYHSKQHHRFISEIIKENSFGIDRRVVDFVATHPYLFSSEIMRHSDDNRPIRHRYLFTIAIRSGKEKKNNTNRTITNNVVKDIWQNYLTLSGIELS